MAKQDFVLPRNLNGTLLTKEITFNMLAYYPLLPWYINLLYFQNPKFLFHHLLDGICILREAPLYRGGGLIRACWGWKFLPWVNRYQIWAFEFAVQETTVIISDNLNLIGQTCKFAHTWIIGSHELLTIHGTRGLRVGDLK